MLSLKLSIFQTWYLLGDVRRNAMAPLPLASYQEMNTLPVPAQQEIQYSEISFLILTLMSREKLTAHCHCPFIQVFTSQGQQVHPKEAKRC